MAEKITSEQKYGISKPPAHQCPAIDNHIRKINALEDDLRYFIKKGDDLEECKSIMDDCLNLLNDLENDLEDLRSAIDGVRSWGGEWKELAKKFALELDK